MNKKLLALAVAAALAPAAAMADTGNVVVYGQMNVSVDSVDTGRVAGGVRKTQINDNSSRLGFKGTESLGNGLTAVWQLEGSVAADGAASGLSGQTTAGSASTAAALGARNTFVGLTGGFGTAILGRHDTPYKLATRGLDVFADGIADNRSLMGQSGNGFTTFDGRQSNVIAYISPTVAGFHGAIGYVAGAENALLSSDVKGDAWSAVGIYANGPIFASLAYEKHNVGTPGTGTLGDPTPAPVPNLQGLNESAWKVGLGYTIDALKLGFAYEKTSDDFGKVGLSNNDVFGHKSYYLSAAYTMGSNVLKLAYTKTGDLNDATDLGNNTGAKQWSVGVDHNMSKRTTVYALYTKLNNDTNGVYGLTGGSNGGVGGGNVTTYLLGASPIYDQDPSAFSLGIRHSF
ncbi:MAG: porin [Sulfuricella sp.]|nr:porin [Sulfuricella sp.]